MNRRAEAARVLAVVGATATGKTALGEALAAAIGGEVVCADSRQVFRQLDVGTGKPTPEQRAATPHHLFDALSLDEPANAGWYARAARDACAGIHVRGRVPVLVGGSGLYLRAAQSGLAPTPPSDPAVRARIDHELGESGCAALHARLLQLDPESAAVIGARDAQRVTRALEVLEVSGHPLSWWHRRPPAPAVEGTWAVLELTLAPGALDDRIAERSAWMLANGLIEETQVLVRDGHAAALAALHAVGYDEAMGVIAGTLTSAGALDRINLRTRQLAKRQRTWFRHQIEAAPLEAGADPALLLEQARRALQC